MFRPTPSCYIFRKLAFPSGYGHVPLLWWHFIVSAQISVSPNLPGQFSSRRTSPGQNLSLAELHLAYSRLAERHLAAFYPSVYIRIQLSSTMSSTTRSRGVLRGLIRSPGVPSTPQSVANSVSASCGAAPASPRVAIPADPILHGNNLVLEKPLGPAVSPLEFFQDTSLLRPTPYRQSTRGTLSDTLSKPFEYAESAAAILRSRGYQPKGSGITLDTDTAKEDLKALRSAISTVLNHIDARETAKLVDTDLSYATYHYDINAIIFAMLSVLLRGAALQLYHSAARSHPQDGRAVLLRLHYEVEGIRPADRGRFMEAMRALRISEREDPTPTLSKFRSFADEHSRLHPHYSDISRVETLLVVLEKSAEESPYEVPLYQDVIGDLYTDHNMTFDTVALRLRRTWQRQGVSRLARFPPLSRTDKGSVAQPSSGGAQAGGDGRAFSLRQRTVVPAEGKWESGSGLYRTWVGTGRPCVTCYRMWGVTDVHPDSSGVCPYSCAASFAAGRAPPGAPTSPVRPQPPGRIPATANHISQPPPATAVAAKQQSTSEPPPVGTEAAPTGTPSMMTVQVPDGGASIDDVPVLTAVQQVDSDDEGYPPLREPTLMAATVGSPAPQGDWEWPVDVRGPLLNWTPAQPSSFTLQGYLQGSGGALQPFEDED